MDSIVRKWVEAANTLAGNMHARVLCPECGECYLKVKDELIPWWDDKMDRYMICDQCGKYNIVTMQLPQHNNLDDLNRGN